MARARHSAKSRYKARRYHDMTLARFTLSGAEVADLCASLPPSLRAMRADGLPDSVAYAQGFALLLDLTLSIWWGYVPDREALAMGVDLCDFVQAAAVASVHHLDRFDPAKSSWRTVSRFVRLDTRKQFTRKASRCAPSLELLEGAIYNNWDGCYTMEGAEDPHGLESLPEVPKWLMDGARGAGGSKQARSVSRNVSRICR